MKKYVYQVVCLTADEYGNFTQEFVLGTYINEFRANNIKDECERQAIEDMQSLEYMIHKYPILDWEEAIAK